MTKAMSLSAAQPWRATISCTIAVRSGVRCAAPAAPTVVQPAGAQAVEAPVVAREVTFAWPLKAAASSLASPRISSEAAPVLTSSVWNWM